MQPQYANHELWWSSCPSWLWRVLEGAGGFSCETLHLDVHIWCSKVNILHFLHQGGWYHVAFKAVWHHFTEQRCFWVAGTSCLLTTELPGMRQHVREVLNIRSCCSINGHFISRRLINQHPNQFGYESIGLQKPLRRYLHTQRAPVRREVGAGRLSPAPARGCSSGTWLSWGLRPQL